MSDRKPRSVPLPLSGPAPAIDQSVWYAEGLSFECTQCGNCCTGSPGYVWLTIDDMEKIADHLGLPFDDFTRTYVRRIAGGKGGGNRFSLLEKKNYDCVFLTRDDKGKAGCRIYSVRPMQCRTWPFWNDNLKAENAWTRASDNCPGMRNPKAPHYDLEHIEKCRQHPESPH
ncbi:MAG TPA: YkgJ family cysteine cluster protein [Phycisphaerae bacterium]|nr:YkgJ family cysteine cluster protein [Phycisphaerae bacterium]